MSKNLIAAGGVGVFVALVLLVGLALARSQEGRGVDAALPEPERNREAMDIDVRITPEGFEPATLRIRSGQIVRWRNESGKPLRLEPGADPMRRLELQGLGSGVLEPGATHAFRPPEPGSYPYRSTADRGETATIEAG